MMTPGNSRNSMMLICRFNVGYQSEIAG